MTLVLIYKGDAMKSIESKYYGLFTKMIPNPALNIMAKNAGIDFVFYDNEHGFIPVDKLHDLVLFGNNIGLPSFVRVCELSRKEICQTLDCGATGIMVPMIETKEQAEQLVQWSKYPPIGNRGYSGGANTNYGPSGGHADYMSSINDKTVTIAQIETKLGVENAEEIVSVEGIDGIIVGPVDLSISLGNVGNIMDPNELEAIQKVVDLCKKYSKTFGIIGTNEILNHFKDDVNYFISAIDTSILKSGLEKSVKDYDRILGENYDRKL